MILTGHLEAESDGHRVAPVLLTALVLLHQAVTHLLYLVQALTQDLVEPHEEVPVTVTIEERVSLLVLLHNKYTPKGNKTLWPQII